MRKLTRWTLALALLLALLATPIMAASNIDEADWYGIITISNNSTATTNVATTGNISTTNLIAGGFLNATANNTVMHTSSGADVLFMPGYTDDNLWCMWVSSIGDNSLQSYILYTAESTGGEFRYFPAAGGMTTPDDDTDLELSDNFSIEQKGWVDTSLSTTAGNAISFNGTNYLEIGDTTDFAWMHGKDNVAAFTWTIEFWMQLDTPEPDAIYALVATNAADTATTGFFFGFDDRSGSGHDKALWLIITKSSGGNPVCDQYIEVAYPNDTDWHHIAITYDQALANTNAKFYVDGASVGTGDKTVNAPNDAVSANELHIGVNGGEASFLTGVLDEIRISDSARTPAEITASYNTGLGSHLSDDANTVALWHLNETTGTIAYDITANDHDSDATTATWVTGHVPTRKYLVHKPEAFETYISGTGNVTSHIIGTSAIVTASGSSANYTVTTFADTANLTISIDGATSGTLFDTIALAGGVTDNSENWTFAANGSMLYMEYQEITIAGVQAQYIEWEYGAVFDDQSTKNNDATPTFRAASSDPDVSAEMTAFLPVAESEAPAYVLGVAPAFIDSDDLTGNVTGGFTTEPPAGTFPLAGVITAIAEATDTPPQLPLLIIATFVILAASLTMSATIRIHGSGSLIVKIITITAVMGVFIGLGNFGIDFWMLVVFLIISVSLAMGSKQIGWQ